MAGRVCLLVVRWYWRLVSVGRHAPVQRLRSQGQCDLENGVPPDRDATDRVVRGGLADDGVKAGLSAQNLQRVTDLGSYQTAWTMLHKFRTVMTSSGRRQLSGRVEMDETYIGGNGKPGVTGRGAAGKTVVAGAVERVGRGFGRARLQVIPDVSSASLAAFLRTHLSQARRSSRTRGPPIRPRSPRQESRTRCTMWPRRASLSMCPCRVCTACSP